MTIDSWTKRICEEYRGDKRLEEMIDRGKSLQKLLPKYQELENLETQFKKIQKNHDFIHDYLRKNYGRVNK